MQPIRQCGVDYTSLCLVTTHNTEAYGLTWLEITKFFPPLFKVGGGICAGYGIYLLVLVCNAGGQDFLLAAPGFLTAIGLLILILGFLGYCAACIKSACLLRTVSCYCWITVRA